MGARLILAASILVVLLIVVTAKRKHRGRSLYERLGGVYAISKVVDHFSDELLKNPIVGANSPNPHLREWSRKQSADRLPGLKFMRTLWVCDAAGGPFKYNGTKPDASHLGLAHAHRGLRITPGEFDEVARVLGASLDHAKVPATEKEQVLAAFAAHKSEVTTGSREVPLG